MRILAFLFLSTTVFAQITYEKAFPNLTFEKPVELLTPPDSSDRIFIIEQRGIIKVFPNNDTVTSTKDFLNIRSKTNCCGERGLLSLAFHPNYKSNGLFYINYNINDGKLKTIISEFKVSANDPDKADAGSERVIMNFEQDFSNHNGGQLLFGDDGYLYIGVGDGGSGGDPNNRAQDTSNILGNVLRIDIDNKSNGKEYAIPADNPFLGKPGMDEIYSYGWRNPWRMSMDPLTKEIWVGDVGQNAIEEISLVKKGANMGWKIMEGDECYRSSNCNQSGLEPPVYTYDQTQGDRSVTGGFVYRGKKSVKMLGKYIYGDYVSGRIWMLEKNGSTVTNEFLFDMQGRVSSFGVDLSGELYMVDYNRNTNTGILRIKDTSVITSSIERENLVIKNIFQPNPAEYYIDIQIPFKNGKILDVNGNIMREFTHKRVDISFLPCGSYFIKLEDDKVDYFDRLIKL